MNYEIEGVKVLSDFSVETAAGGVNKAIIKEFDIAVGDGNGMQIVATKGTGDNVFDAGLEIMTASGVSTIRGSKVFDGKHIRLARVRSGGFNIHVEYDGAFYLDLLRSNGTVAASFDGKGSTIYVWRQKLAAGAYMVRLRSNGYSESIGPVIIH
jgi:hypothetical protein